MEALGLLEFLGVIQCIVNMHVLTILTFNKASFAVVI